MENPIQHQSFTIKQLSNKELLSHTKLLVQKERRIHIQVLRHLAEIDSRKLFFKQGFFSLFDYAVRELGYSEGAAYRRIKAMKLCCALPETANRLQSGRLSLSAASQLQVFFEKQDKKIKEEAKKALSLKPYEGRVSVNEAKEQQKPGEERILIKTPKKEILKKEETGEYLKIADSSQNEDLNRTLPLSQEEKENLVKKVEGCSTRTTEKLLSEADPSLSLLKREKVRFLGKDKVEVKIVIDEKCHKELEKLKNLLSHRNPKLSYGELISILSKEALKKHDPGEKNIRQRKEEKVQKNPSVKKPEFKDKSAELAITSAPKLRQKDEIPEHSLSGKPVISALRSEQINQYSKEKASTSAPKLRQKDEIPEHSLSGKPATSAPKLKQKDEIPEHSLSGKPVISALRSEQTDQYFREKPAFALKPKHQIKKISRYIPSHLRKYIWARDQGQCTYVHHETKRRCTCRHLLQIDHIQPFALGGRTEKENLRLLCAGHNQYRR